MNIEFLCFSLLRTGLVLAVVAGIVHVLLRFFHCRNVRVHRLAWCFVIMQGIFWVQWPMNLAVLDVPVEPVLETASKDIVSEETIPKPMVFPLLVDAQPPLDSPENPPRVDSPSSSQEEVSAVSAMVLEPASEPVVLPAGPMPVHPDLSRLKPASWFLGIWIAGIAVCIVFHVFTFLRLMFSLWSSRLPSEEHLEQWKTLFGHEKRLGLLLTEQIGPAVVRLPGQAFVLVPQSFWEEASPSLRLGILKHEFSHYQHRDGLKSLIFSMFAVAQWFNPASWWALKRFNEAAEWRCDAEAYGNDEEALVHFAESMLLLHRTSPRYIGVLPTFRSRDLNERVRRLKEHQTQPKEHVMKNTAIIILLVLLLCFGFLKINLVAKTKPNETIVPGPESLVAEPSLPADNATVIRGQVFDELGKAVGGVKVYLPAEDPDQDQSTLTDENGDFSLKKPEFPFYGTVYAVDADQKRIGNTNWSMNTKTGEIKAAVISLVKASRVITGTVLDADDHPAKDILVVGCHQIARSEIVRTDQDGKFQFLFPDEEVLLRIVAFRKGVGLDICATEEIDPYQPIGELGVTPPDKISNGPFHLKLSPTEPVKIRVVTQDGTPIPGAIVYPWLIQKPCKLPKPDPVMWDSPYHKERKGNQFNTSHVAFFNTLTDENGIAVIDTVPKDFLEESTFNSHGTGVEQPDGTKRYYGHATNQWNKMVFEEGLPTLTLPRQGTVFGSVKLEDGTPVPGVGIGIRWHNGSGGSRQTDENGEFTLKDNANVIYNLSFSSDKGTAPSIFNYSVGDGSEEKRLDVVLRPGIRFHGKVFMPDGSPASDFSISSYEKDPNPPASFSRRTSENWEAGRDGTLYMNDEADHQVYPQNFHPGTEKGEPGAYETCLPAVPREYRFRAVKYPSKENPKEITANVRDVRLLGTEKELKLDFFLSESGDNSCTPLAETPSTPTDEKAKPLEPGTQQPWVDTPNDPESSNPMIPVNPVIKVLDTDGNPMKDVEIDVQYNGDDRGGFKVKTDENGIASAKELETKKNTGFISYSIKQSGYVFRLAEWQRGYGCWNDLPKEHLFTMEKAVEVGGIVIDENNKPIQGATVDCTYNAPDRENHLYPAGSATTDAEGRWSVNMAPASVRKFRLDVKHPETMPSELTGTYPPYEQMRDRTSVVMLRKGTTLSGQVLDPDGKPVPNAKIVMTEKGQEFSSVQPQRTNEEGGFTFQNIKPGATNVYVAAVGFAPQVKECTDFSQPVAFRLEPGKTVRFQVLDMDGKPIANARVCPFRWRGTFMLLGDRDMIPQHADEQGNWVWTWAPDDPVEYSIIREGYQSIRDLQLEARKEPYVYKMRLPLEIRGNVTDAQTGEVVSNITLISGGNFDGKNPKQASYWNKDRPSRFSNGKYRAFFDEPRNGGGHHFMIEAEGYEPFVSEMFTDDQGSLTLDVQLKPVTIFSP